MAEEKETNKEEAAKAESKEAVAASEEKKTEKPEEAKASEAKETQELEVDDVAGMDADAQPDIKGQQKNPEKFLKEFNWHNYEEGIDKISDDKLDEFEKLVEENFVETLEVGS